MINDNLQFNGLTGKFLTNDLILRIPAETPGCVYQLNSAAITLYLPTNVAENHCQIGNVMKIIPNENFELRYMDLDHERHNDVIGPFKVTVPPHRMDDLGLSNCIYARVQTQKVPSGDFKVVLPPLSSVSSVKNIGWVFRFALPNPSCVHPEVSIQDILSHEKRPIGKVSRDNGQLQFDGISDGLISNALILRIPQETPDCVYEMKSGAITLVFDMNGLGDQCQVGNVLNMVPNDLIDPPHGQTDSYSMDNWKETSARSDENINNLHLQKKTVLSMVQEWAGHSYEFLLNEQPEEGKERRREIYEMFHRIFDKIQEFATGNLQKPNEALFAITAACKSLSLARHSPKRITVLQFTILMGHKLPSGSIPTSLIGVKVLDGVENFAKYDYRLIWKQMSKQEKVSVTFTYQTLSFAYNHIKPFADDLTVRSQVESATEKACSYINLYIEDPQQHLDYKTVGVFEYRRKWYKYAPKKKKTAVSHDHVMPLSLKGLGLVDGVHKYYRDNYEKVFKDLSPQDKPLYRRHLAKVRNVAKKIAAFSSKDLRNRRNVEEAVALACYDLNSFSGERHRCDVETTTLSAFATDWSKYAPY